MSVVLGQSDLSIDICRALGFDPEENTDLTLTVRMPADSIITVEAKMFVNQEQAGALVEVLRKYRLCLEEITDGSSVGKDAG